MSVIGYKGTNSTRKEDWDLLLLYRKAIDFDRENRLDCLERTINNYNKIFKGYVSG